MEQKPNTGIFFRNEKKSAENQPDFKGKVNVNGKDMEVAVWLKKGQKGEYFTMKFQEPFKPQPQNKTFKNDMPF